MEKYVYSFLDNLFKMAERVTGCSARENRECRPQPSPRPQSSLPKADSPKPTIRFSREDKMVEGELF